MNNTVLLLLSVLTLGIISMVYTIQKCGFTDVLFLGKGATYAAYSGMCDK